MALRRAAMLLERVRQDAIGREPVLEELEAGVSAIRRAVAAGHSVHSSAVERLSSLLVCIPSAPAPDLSARVRRSVLAEVGEVLGRLISEH